MCIRDRLWPWNEQRYFAPWRPILVSPFANGFFSARGMATLLSELRWVWPVSYTHLDVYKRQGFGDAMRGFVEHQRARFAGKAAQALAAVSYTHLDVYKRQELERMLSPAFIRGPQYGTRASTLIAIDYEGRGWISERSFGPDGLFQGEATLPIA